MTQADSVHSTPPINTSANNVKSQQKALARQAAQRQRALKRIRKLRAKAADEIDRLLEFIDAVDDTDVDSQCDDDPCDDDELDDPEEDEESEPDEPSLGSSNDHNGHGAVYDNNGGRVIDGEGPDDDLESNLGGGDGSDREEDRADEEPSLGWTERAEEGSGCCGGFEDREQCVAVGTEADYERFRASKIDGDPTAGVDVERGYGTRRIRNLSDCQRQILRPKVDCSKVTV